LGEIFFLHPALALVIKHFDHFLDFLFCNFFAYFLLEGKK